MKEGFRWGIVAPAAVLTSALLSLAALPPAAGAAEPATIKGTLGGGRLPGPEEGAASVRAVRLVDGMIAAGDYTAGKRERWRLETPPGWYALIGAVVSFQGRATIDRPLALVRARGGRSQTVALDLKPERKEKRLPTSPRQRRLVVSEGFGDVDVDFPAVWVKHFEVQSQDRDLDVLSKGIADMLITDLVSGREARPGCHVVIVEREKIGELLKELKLQQLPGFDPSARVPEGHIIRDNSSVTGTVAESGGQMTLTATYQNRRTGERATVAVQGPSESFFELEQELAQKLIAAICPPDTPSYSGSFAGSANYDSTQVGAGNSLTANWSGTLRLEPFAPTPPNTNYQVISGSLNYSFSGRANNCDVAGSTTVMLPTFDMSGVNAMTIFPGDPNTYQLTIGMPMEQAPGTKSNCTDPDDNGDDFNWHLQGGVPAMVASSDPADGPHPIPIPPDGVLSGSATGGGSGGTPAQTWTWNLVPDSG